MFRYRSLLIAVLVLGLIAGMALAQLNTRLYLSAIMRDAPPGPPTPPPGNAVTFPLNMDGHVDVTSHQIIRGSGDRVFVIAGKVDQPTLRVFATTSGGLPTATGNFSAGATVDLPEGKVVSVSPAYNGTDSIFILANTWVTTTTSRIYGTVYTISSNTFSTPQLLSLNPAPGTMAAGLYIGTAGVSAAAANANTLHMAYWAAGYQIGYCALTVTGGTYSACTPQVLDASGGAHPVIAIAPSDGSITVAWADEEAGIGRIMAATRSATGTFSPAVQVSDVNVQAYIARGSNRAQIDFDQGPSLVIDSTGRRHLVYIESYDNVSNPQQYGRVHFASSSDGNAAWSDEALNVYSSTTGLGLAGSTLYMFGRGSEYTSASAASAPCRVSDNMCYLTRPLAGGVWGPAALAAAPPSGFTFNASPSIKWSGFAMGQPSAVEFVFYAVPIGNYYDPRVYYGRLP